MTHQSQEFSFNGDNNLAFYGIIHHLSEACGGNVHLHNIVDVACSSCYLSHGSRENSVDLNNPRNYFQSNNERDAWLQYDFKDKKIRPTHYSIRSRHDFKNNFMVNWIIEGSNSDGENKDWKILDRRSNVTCLCEQNAQNTFDINSILEPNESFRFLRIRQTGSDSDGLYYLTFSALEFFGTIFHQ